MVFLSDVLVLMMEEISSWLLITILLEWIWLCVLLFYNKFIREVFEKLYNYQCNRPLSTDIRFIGNKIDYAHFIDIAYEEPKIIISIYMEHTEMVWRTSSIQVVTQLV